MADVKLFRPQRLTDNPDGGGLATATEIIDGEVNNLFDDISRIDRVNGELSLRKVFALAATDDTELYSDVHAIVQAPPLDPRVSSVLFRTGAWGDERADAQNYVERYLDPSVITRMIPYDRQLQGQRTVLVYQRPELSLPEIGEVYALTNDTTGQSEFFRIQDVDHEVQTFTDTQGDYQARVIVLTISQPLTQEFSGSQPNRYFTADALKSIVRSSIASDAARYKGVVALAEDADPGDLTIRVESIFAQLVPAATSEVAVVDAPPEGATLTLASSESPLTQNMGIDSGTLQRYLHRPAAPGVVVEFTFGAGASARWEEQLDGTFLRTVGTHPATITLNATRDALQFSQFTGGTGWFVATYLPAVVIAGPAQTHQIPVEIANRGYVYIHTMRPLPRPGTLSVSYRALGKWYTLRDDGTGALRADPGIGTGSVNFQTGTASVSLGALPDVGSAVVWSWGVASEYEIRTGDLDIDMPAVLLQLASGNCEPGTLEVEWEAGGTPRNATAAADGTLSGDATGRVIHATGMVELRPAVVPDSNTLFTCSYEAGTTTTEVYTPSATGGSVVVTASELPRPGSVQLSFLAFAQNPYGATGSLLITLSDDGTGGLVDEAGAAVAGGSVVYGTGVVTFPTTYVRTLAQLQRADYGGVLPDRVPADLTGQFDLNVREIRIPNIVEMNDGALAGFINGTAVSLTYKEDTVVDAVQSEEHEPSALTVDLTPRVRNAVVPGGVLFGFAGRIYYDRQGVLYYGMSPTTGAGTAGGTIDYSTGLAALTSYEGGGAPDFTVLALLTEVAPLPVYIVHGRTPGSPLRPGTFTIQANRGSDGELISGTSDNNGNIDTLDMHGVVDSVTGVYAVAFGRYVLDSSLSPEEKAEDWYDVSLVDADGYVWRPAEVIPGTVRFNCVVQASLPQDPEIIKVNPVRLPMDGRVPVIRAGDTLVIHDPQPFTLPADLEAGQVVALPRGGLASVAFYDQAGLGVPVSMFALVDLEAGEVTLATPLDLAGYEEPLVAIHTVEDMALCLDAQITGEVSLGQALTHGYSAANALVSSALILGDAQARYGELFAQHTWTGVWSDDLIGTPPTSGGQYNDASFPLELLNRDTIGQRWRLTFTSSTEFAVIGEGIGNVGTGNTTDGAAPLNPATGEPYFEILGAGFGAGWSTGNTIRFNTYAAGGPIWVARTVRSGPATNFDDRIRLQVRWDKD